MNLDQPTNVTPVSELEDVVCRLSRHVHIRPVDGAFVAESSLSGSSVRLSGESVFKLLLTLTLPVRVGALVRAAPEGQRAAVLAFVRQALDGQLLTVVNDHGVSAEDRSASACWEPHDLWFHTRSRRGRTRAPVGASYRLRGVLENEPATKPIGNDAPPVPLAAPRREVGQGPSLTTVLHARRTQYSMEPVSLVDLGVFLYHSARVTGVSGTGELQHVSKPFPSAGSLHSLEVYIVASNCTGLNAGLYHYRAIEHELRPVCGYTDDVAELLREAQVGTAGLSGNPPVLVVITSRFRRVMWKYESMAYHVILQEVGALYQTMYLVATSMRLAPCALGAGDSVRFARLIGSDYYDETSVGEFILAGPRTAAHSGTSSGPALDL